MIFRYRWEAYWRNILASEIKASIDSGSELNAYGAFLLVRDGRLKRVSWGERRMHKLFFDVACNDPSVVRLLSRAKFKSLTKFVRGLSVSELSSPVCVSVLVEMVLSPRSSKEFVLWVWGSVQSRRVRDAVLACNVLSDEDKVVLALMERSAN
jgi:hypothetical protein